MSREIKFRVWSIQKNAFFVQDDIAIENTGGVLLYDFNEEYHKHWHSIYDNHTIQQYTGLKDKNSVEIYEGDIVQVRSEQYINENYVGTIIFDEGSFLTKISDNDIRGVFSGEDEDIVVIGNIHENPELLKQ